MGKPAPQRQLSNSSSGAAFEAGAATTAFSSMNSITVNPRLTRWRAKLRRLPATTSIRYSLPQASTRSATLLVKQFYASCFKSTADGGGVCEGHCRPAIDRFCTTDC
jgi:hypothetical protein